MDPKKRVNILVVDDQPAKLLSLEVILADLDENVIKAESADEALAQLLKSEIAVVLVDVCMPHMDGFEFAEFIRSHPRFRRIPIIFISAVYLTDADRLKGYDVGAVDYIPVPIIPEILRAKVGLFAELSRKTEQLEDLNRQLGQRVQERTADLDRSAQSLRDSEERFQQIARTIDEVFWLAEIRPRFRILYVSPAWEKIWGRPIERLDWHARTWLEAIHVDDRYRVLEDVRVALRSDGQDTWDHEYRITRPDGDVKWIRERGRIMRDSSGQIKAAGVAEDITERRAAARERDRLLAILEATPDFVATCDLQGRTRYLNPAARHMLGLTSDADLGNHSIADCYPDEVAHFLAETALPSAAQAGVWEGESRINSSSGAAIPVSQVIIAHKDQGGHVEVFSTVARDITERKRAEKVLERDREALERLMDERTAELEQSNERLRHADRMAMIGTLSAGLGHDMGNLLVPVRVRLESLSKTHLAPESHEDVAAIQTSIRYLQRLANGLRLLALDPHRARPNEVTELSNWWADAGPMFRNVLPRGVCLESRMSEGECWVQISRAGLTQAVFNLVQNAGDAMRGMSEGTVTVWNQSDGDNVIIGVKDNGPGMSDEVRRRCVEPFYTTKPRGISTGLGLTLVYGLLHDVGGSLTIDSAQDEGTEFRLTLARAASPSSNASTERAPFKQAIVDIRDDRIRAFAISELRSLGFETHTKSRADVSAHVALSDDLELLSSVDANTRIVALGDASRLQGRPGVIALDLKPTLKSLRQAIHLIAEESAPRSGGVSILIPHERGA